MTKDYLASVIFDVELYTALRALAEEAATGSAPQEESAEPPATVLTPESAPPAIAEPEPAPARRGGRRRKAQGDT